MNTTPCRKCGKPIGFIKLKKGTTMPVDPEEEYYIAESGGPNAYVTQAGEVKHGYVSPHPDVDKFCEIGYVSHFATCPYAGNFRSRDKKKG